MDDSKFTLSLTHPPGTVLKSATWCHLALPFHTKQLSGTEIELQHHIYCTITEKIPSNFTAKMSQAQKFKITVKGRHSLDPDYEVIYTSDLQPVPLAVIQSVSYFVREWQDERQENTDTNTLLVSGTSAHLFSQDEELDWTIEDYDMAHGGIQEELAMFNNSSVSWHQRYKGRNALRDEWDLHYLKAEEVIPFLQLKKSARRQRNAYRPYLQDIRRKLVSLRSWAAETPCLLDAFEAIDAFGEQFTKVSLAVLKAKKRSLVVDSQRRDFTYKTIIELVDDGKDMKAALRKLRRILEHMDLGPEAEHEREEHVFRCEPGNKWADDDANCCWAPKSQMESGNTIADSDSGDSNTGDVAESVRQVTLEEVQDSGR